MAPGADPLHWREAGSPGSPVVLCLHGQFLDGRSFDALSERLADRWRVLVPDLPGNGRSPLPRPYSLEGVREAVERGLAIRGVRESAVVGCSIGAYHALGMALAGEFRVSRLALLGPIAGADPEVKEAFAGYARALAGGVDLVEPFLGLALPATWAEAHPAETATLRARAAEAPRATLAAECDAIGRMADLRPRLRELRVPALVRVGDADRNTPPAWGEAMARAMPGAVLQVVSGVGHLPLVQDAEATSAALERFLS